MSGLLSPESKAAARGVKAFRVAVDSGIEVVACGGRLNAIF